MMENSRHLAVVVMPTLFSYCIPIDDGAAPNPYWGTCTLVICKPKIRLTAEEGDWVVGTGSVSSPIGDVSGCVVYAMKVTRKMTMRQYDAFTASRLAQKIPDWNSLDIRRRLEFLVDTPYGVAGFIHLSGQEHHPRSC